MLRTPLNINSTRWALPKALWITWLISFILLVFVGGALFFTPAIAQKYWPWPLAPFNTRFLGAIYGSATLPLLGYLIRPRINYLRIVLPVFACFTTYLFLVSIGYSDNFLTRRSAAIWFFLYGADSFVGGFYCWKLRQKFRLEHRKSEASLRLSCLRPYSIQAMILGVYGTGLLLMAPIVGRHWLWPLDTFHSRLYGGVFLSGALTMGLLNAYSTRHEQIMLGLTQLCLGVSIAMGNWMVDSQIHRLDWASLTPWAWQGCFLVFGVLGGWSLVRAWLFETRDRA